MSLTVAAAEDEPTPAEQYREYLKRTETSVEDFERQELVSSEIWPSNDLTSFRSSVWIWPRRTLPPVALQALLQANQVVVSVDSLAHHAAEMNRDAFPQGSQRDAAKRIVKLLPCDHKKSNRLAPICRRR